MALVCKYQLLRAEVSPDKGLELNAVLLVLLQGWLRDLCMGLSYSFDQVEIQHTVFIEYPALWSMHMIICIEVSVSRTSQSPACNSLRAESGQRLTQLQRNYRTYGEKSIQLEKWV